MAGSEDAHRIRIGDYRVVYEIDEPAQILTIITIGHRKDVYRGR